MADASDCTAAILAREGVESTAMLLEKHRGRIWRTAFRFLRNPEDALDVTQEVLLKLHQNLASLGADISLAAWLTRVTANASLNFTRQERTRRRYHLAVAGQSPVQVEAGPVVGLGPALAGAIAALPRGQRAVVTLRLLEERTFREIAQAFDVSESTVKIQFARALRRLRSELQEWM
jgi:RNA polymerase sigma-70 factor (ECF subfamily)